MLRRSALSTVWTSVSTSDSWVSPPLVKTPTTGHGWPLRETRSPISRPRNCFCADPSDDQLMRAGLKPASFDKVDFRPEGQTLRPDAPQGDIGVGAAATH